MLSIHIKDANLPVGVKPQDFCSRLVMDAIINSLQEMDKSIIRKEHSNDAIIIEDSKEKKVVGTWSNSYKKGWTTYACMLNLKGNFTLMNRVFKLKTNKMDVFSITDAVGEIDKELQLDKSILARKIAEKFAVDLQHKLTNGQLSQVEIDAMDNVKEVLASNEWIYKAKRPIEHLKEEQHKFEIEDYGNN